MSSENRVVVVGGVRTPFVRAGTVFKDIPPSTLGGVTLRETVARTDIDPKLIDEVYYGIVSPPADGPNVSREAVFDSDLPPEIPCTTVNRYCASASEAVAGITAKIQAGQIDIGIAGGVESISSIRALFSKQATEYFQSLMKAKTTGQKLQKLTEFSPKFLAPQAPGINEPTTGLSMGQSGDLMARAFKVGREEQDQYALESHKKAQAGWDNGFFKSHVVPVSTPEGKVIDQDPDIRADSTMEKLSTLRPVFYKDGTITAANASPLTDGASACLLMSEKKANELKLQPLGVIRGYAATAVDIKKEPLLIGPAYGIPKALKAANLSWNDIDLIEMHEAFAAQVLSTIRAIESDEWAKEKLGASTAIGKVDRSKLNLHGGSIPIGHPFGATGVRVLLQCLHLLRREKKKYGLISVCAAGGMGSVTVVEAL